MNQQTAKTVKEAQPAEASYRMVDGGGLYLLVNPTGSKLWRLKHKGSLLALGAYPTLTLADARARRAAAKLPRAPDAPRDTSPTFQVTAADWHAAQTNWGATNRRLVWRALEDNAFPQIGDIQLAQITKIMIFERVVTPFEALE